MASNSNGEIVKKYIGDLLGVVRHCEQAVERQLNDDEVSQLPRGLEVVGRIRRTLGLQSIALENRLIELNGSAIFKETVTNITGFFAGLYDKIRGQTASRALRDNYTALNFIFICQSMLITTAEACGDGYTGRMVREHQKQIPPLILRVGEIVPEVVVSDLAKDGATVLPAAAEQAIQAQRDAWQAASTNVEINQ